MSITPLNLNENLSSMIEKFHNELSQDFSYGKFTVNEVNEVIEWFVLLPKDYWEANFNKIVNEYLYNGRSYFEKSNKAFSFFLKHDYFKEFLPQLNQSLTDDKNVFSMLVHSLNELDVDMAQQFSDVLLLPKRRQLKLIKKNFSQAMRQDNKIVIQFFLKNFSGWTENDNLDIIFSDGVLDDKFLNQYVSQYGVIQEADKQKIISHALTSRKISIERISDIVSKIMPEFSYNSYLHTFLTENLMQKNFTIEEIKETNPYFFTAINNQDYINDFMLDSINTFYKNKDFYNSLGITDEQIKLGVEYCIRHVDPEKSGSSSNHDKNVIYHKILTSYEYDYNNIYLQKNLIDIFDYDAQFMHNAYNKLYQKYGNKINENLDLSEAHGTYRLKDVLEGNTQYFLKTISQDKIIDLEKMKNLVSLPNKEYMDDFLKKLSTQYSQEFFEKFFLNAHYYSKLGVLLNPIFQHFTLNSPTLIFDLKTKNPLYGLTQSIKQATYCSYTPDFLQKLIVFLGYDIVNLPLESGKPETATSFLKKEFSFYAYFLKENQDKFTPTKVGWKTLFSKDPEALQLVVENNKARLIYNEAELIKEVQVIPTSSVVDDLVQKNTQNLTLLNKLLEDNSDKSLLIDAKIKSEKILLDSITFLKGIKEVEEDIDNISFDNMHFMQNNLGKYLLESMNSYTKACSRYDNLSLQNTHSFDDLEKIKDKMDKEVLRQLDLLQTELSLVQKNVLNSFHEDILKDMRIRTRVLETHLEETQNNQSDNITSLIRIVGKP